MLFINKKAIEMSVIIKRIDISDIIICQFAFEETGFLSYVILPGIPLCKMSSSWIY